MSQAPTPTPLDYYRPKLVKQPQTPESIRWRWYRVGYRIGLAVLFVSIAFYFGPNEIMFNKSTRLDPNDFVPVIQSDCIATVRAVKQYQQHSGSLPKTIDNLPGGMNGAFMNNGRYEYIVSRWGEVITYDFTPSSEGWYASGRYITGRIPLPAVNAVPVAKQGTHP